MRAHSLGHSQKSPGVELCPSECPHWLGISSIFKKKISYPILTLPNLDKVLPESCRKVTHFSVLNWPYVSGKTKKNPILEGIIENSSQPAC